MKRRYDVIIVGCGVAGCFAALHLPESARILMVTKRNLRKAILFSPREAFVFFMMRQIMTAFLKTLCGRDIMKIEKNRWIL
jgi:flavin-dependent dehydrogenase